MHFAFRLLHFISLPGLRLGLLNLMSSCSSCSSVSSAQSDALSQQISIAALKKQNDAAKAQGAAVVKLLQSAAKISKAAGKGDSFDAVG